MGTSSTDDRSTSDAALLGRMAAGDERALGELYDRYGGVAYGLATAMTDSPASAESVVADAFAQLWRDAHALADTRLDALSSLTTLVRSIALSRRAPRTRPFDHSQWTMPAQGSAASGRVDDTSGTHELPLASPIAGALSQLTEVQRRAVELAYFRGLSWREIAVELGVPEGNVASQLRSALDSLRPVLSLRTAAPESLRIARA